MFRPLRPLVAAFALIICLGNVNGWWPRVCAQERPPQKIGAGLQNSADGSVSLDLSSLGRPLTFTPGALRFTWQAYNTHGRPTGAPSEAHVELGSWKLVDPPSGDTAPDKLVVREYRASLQFIGNAPGAPGMYRLKIVAADGFAHTDTGTAVPLDGDNSTTGAVYWPDERNDDAAVRDLRSRILERTVYAFGGSRVGCYGSVTFYPSTAPLLVTKVERHRGVAYYLDTVEAQRNDEWMNFFAIDPIEVKVTTNARPSGSGGSSDVEQPCVPGFRFADPWHAGLTITSATPPPDLLSRKIDVGMTRHDVLWIFGFPNPPSEYATAQALNNLDEWDYPTGGGRAPWSFLFKHDRVVKYTTPPKGP